MNDSYKKVFDTISQLSQLSNLSQFVKVESFPPNQQAEKFENSENIPEESKYIYIGKDDLVKLFPQLEGKLDVTNILSGLLGKLPALKNIIPTDETSAKPAAENSAASKETSENTQTITQESENSKEE